MQVNFYSALASGDANSFDALTSNTTVENDRHPQASSLSTQALGGGGPQFILNADARTGVADNGKPHLSIDQAAERIVSGEPHWSTTMGAGLTMSYAFRADAPGHMPDDAGGFSRFDEAQINQTELALRSWSDVANITFVRAGSGAAGEAAYSDNATILLGNYATGEAGAGAVTIMPGNAGISSASGDVWINSTYSDNSDPTVGNYGGQSLVHELGHAIGLGHPSDYNVGANVVITYSAGASYYEDSRQYTVMSYFSEANTGGADGGLYSAAPLMDDIAAAQLEYGPNMSARTGDTVYGFNSNAGQPWFIADSSATKLVFAVWDAGGADTFDFSGYADNQLIDLRAGSFSNVGGLIGDVSIAQNVIIENAIGGSGADLIQGNDAGNQIFGGAGDDTLSAGNGSNYLRGGPGDDMMMGGAGFNDMNGNQGADTIHGGSDGNWVVGGQGGDLLFGGGGANIILGNLGDDTLHAGEGNDVLRGGQGNDLIFGGPGSDFISGDLGSNTETGGAGADTFHSFAAVGQDVVTNFSEAKGDHVQLDPGTSYSLTQVGADTVISMGSGGQIILQGVAMASLHSGWIAVG